MSTQISIEELTELKSCISQVLKKDDSRDGITRTLSHEDQIVFLLFCESIRDYVINRNPSIDAFQLRDTLDNMWIGLSENTKDRMRKMVKDDLKEELLQSNL